MTDEGPEPPSTSADGGDSGDTEATEPADLSGGMESIADLIDEAARTAAEQAEREATGEEPQDRSADVWGDEGTAGTSNAEAVWAAEGTASSDDVWDEEDQDADVWSAQRGQTPFAGTDPLRQPAGDPDPADGTPTPGPEAPVDDTEEPETYAFAIDEQAPPSPSASPEEPVQEWPDASDDVADADQDPDDVWTSGVADAPDQAAPTGDEASLAESAQPRRDTGWLDLEAEQEPSWTVPDLPQRVPGDFTEGEPTESAATAEEAHEADGDSGDDGGGGGGVALPADVVTAEVHDALGDLLGNGEQDAIVGGAGGDSGAPTPAQDTAPEPAADAPEGGPLDQLADFDLDQFDDLDAREASPDAAADDQESPPPAADAGEEDGHDDRRELDEGRYDDKRERSDGQLDAPAAARRVMEPGSVSFSSDKKKKRGFFR